MLCLFAAFYELHVHVVSIASSISSVPCSSARAVRSIAALPCPFMLSSLFQSLFLQLLWCFIVSTFISQIALCSPLLPSLLFTPSPSPSLQPTSPPLPFTLTPPSPSLPLPSQAQLQRESSERAMRFEVDSLKARIVTGHDQLGSSSSSGSAARNAELQEMVRHDMMRHVDVM